MIIRKATIKDFDGMNRVFQQVDDLHSEAVPHIFKTTTKPSRSDEYLTSIIDNDMMSLLVAEVDGKIVGVAKADILESPDIPLFVNRRWMDINTIVVDDQYRGKGVGKRLLDTLYAWARSEDVHEVELTVFAFNEAAIEFYKKNGYVNKSYKMSTKL